MVADGCSFMASYSAMPQCQPARTCWYTGRMSSETNVPRNDKGSGCLPELPDLGQWLARHGGYGCAFAGKWHVPGRDVTKSFRLVANSGRGEFANPFVTRACLGYLANYDRDKPFFLVVSLHNPHDCCTTSGAAGSP